MTMNRSIIKWILFLNRVLGLSGPLSFIHQLNASQKTIEPETSLGYVQSSPNYPFLIIYCQEQIFIDLAH